jgi:hypothetical protein
LRHPLTADAAYNTFVDASLALLPSTIFWSLKIHTEDKIKLSIVFALNILQVPAPRVPARRC